MVTVQLPDHVFQQLTAAAAAERVTLEKYLEKRVQEDLISARSDVVQSIVLDSSASINV